MKNANMISVVINAHTTNQYTDDECDYCNLVIYELEGILNRVFNVFEKDNA